MSVLLEKTASPSSSSYYFPIDPQLEVRLPVYLHCPDWDLVRLELAEAGFMCTVECLHNHCELISTTGLLWATPFTCSYLPTHCLCLLRPFSLFFFLKWSLNIGRRWCDTDVLLGTRHPVRSCSLCLGYLWLSDIYIVFTL